MNDKKVEPIQADDIFQLADAINEFSKTHEIFSTQIYQKDKGYDCLIWYNLNKPENIFKKPIGEKNINIKKDIPQEKATDKQIFALNKLGIKFDKNITKQEAFLIIKEKKQIG